MDPMPSLTRPPAPLSMDELRDLVVRREIETVAVAFPDHYGRLLGKRVDAEFFVAEVGDRGTHACNYLLTADMEMEPVAGYRFANWEQGYGDVHLVPDLATLCRAAWAPGSALVLCDVHDESTGAAVDVAPRSVLAGQIDRLADRGLVAMVASELEFFLFQESYRGAAERGHRELTPSGWYIDDYHLLHGARVEPYVGEARRSLRDSGIPVESSKGEWGRGQHELNIRYSDVATMADRHVVMKHAMKELADAAGVSVTFMAKPHAGEAGSSCHLHVSLWDAGAATNAFTSDPPPDPASDPGSHTDLFRWFLGGWMAHAAELMLWYAPTVNSYKRYQHGSWAPTRLAWSHDNRTAAFRVVGRGAGRRIECRIPGADCNPYLAYAAALISGLDGIERRIEPPAELRGDAYGALDAARLPLSLEAAIDSFTGSALVRGALGDDVVDHYARLAETEVAEFRRSVTDWERARYFERI